MYLDKETGLKKCSRCRQLKTAEAYSKNRTAKDGLQGTCKECRKSKPARTDFMPADGVELKFSNDYKVNKRKRGTQFWPGTRIPMG